MNTLRAPFTGRARRELLFCVLSLPFGIFLPLAGFIVTIRLALLAAGSPWVSRGNPSWWAILAAGAAAALLIVLLVVTGAARGLTAACRGLASRLLGERVPAPPPPPPGVQLSPVTVITPFDWFGNGHFRVATFPGTFAAFGTGAGRLLAAPWVTRAVVAVDRWLIRGLLGPGTVAQRLKNLEQTRALAVDDAAAQLRRLERDLHDGAQIRLATLAMNLGMAKQKLGDRGEVPDAEAARELVDAAHQGAKDALSELRELARGIHPPVLDNGLPDALATLAASTAIPAELAVSLPVRPRAAIETIAYFCAAELLANAAKHSNANKIKINLTERTGVLVLRISDDGAGGAVPARGSGLSGLRDRVSTVDGRLDITSPPGGPTRIVVELPLRAG